MTRPRSTYELRPGRFEPPRGEIDQSLRIRFAGHKRLEHRAATGPEDIADGLGQLHIRVFERLLDALRVARDLPDELLARPREISQVLNGRGRDEATPDQPHRQQVGQPPGVFHIALAARDVAHVHGVGQRERKLAVEHVPDGLPVDARRFHRHVRAPLGGQPVGELE